MFSCIFSRQSNYFKRGNRLEKSLMRNILCAVQQTWRNIWGQWGFTFGRLVLVFQSPADFVYHIVMSPHDLKIFRRECSTSALANQIFLLCRSYFIVFYSRASRTSWLNRSWRCAKYLSERSYLEIWQVFDNKFDLPLLTVLWVATASALAGTSYYTA